MLKKILLCVWVALLFGCSDATLVGPASVPELRTISPDCYEGCLEEDPDPEAPGYFVAGQMYSYDGCTDVDYDVDQDGMDDYCETLLAQLFAPLMSFLYGDDVSRDMRWAVRAEDGTVVIAYLLGYYLDNGSPLCFSTWGQCTGHQGDAEWVSVSVSYNSTSHHWEMLAAELSRHTSPRAFYRYGGSMTPRSYFGRAIEFPDVFLGYPRIYASDGKHANYATDAECDAGEGNVWIPNTDECASPRYSERFDAGNAGNVGSRWHPFVDCVQTANTAHPAYAIHATECYWTDKPFEGWFYSYPAATTSGYADVLAHLGF